MFCYDNPPGKKIISGSQDSIDIVNPDLAIAYYEGEHWTKRIEHIKDAKTEQFIEESLYLVAPGPCHAEYDVLENTNTIIENVCALSQAAENCWNAFLNHDIYSFGQSYGVSFEAQIAIFTNMINDHVSRLID